MDVLGVPSPQSHESVYLETATGLNLRNLKSVDLVRLLNSTPMGNVITERQLYRHRMRAGFRIGGARRIDLFRYVSWLVQLRHEAQPRNAYIRLKETARKRHTCNSELPELFGVTAEGVIGLLEHQDYRCALTGRTLTPDTAALDHITPVSRGGEHRIGNAQILHKAVNRAKGTLTNEEFIQLCREVVAHADEEGGMSS